MRITIAQARALLESVMHGAAHSVQEAAIIADHLPDPIHQSLLALT